MAEKNFNFYARPSEAVAKALLNANIIRKLPTGDIKGKIIETGAYEGGSPTKSRKGMLYKPGTVFLMPHRGLTSINIATGEEYMASCVEIRAAQFEEQLIETPYKLANFLSISYKDISKNLDGKLIGDELFIEPLGKCLPDSQIVFKRPISKSDNCIGYYSIEKKSAF